MNRKQALVAALVVECAALMAPTVSAQGASAGRVDVRSVAPSPTMTTTSDIAASASGLTRDQRKEQTIKARADGTLKPAGEAAEFRDDAAGRAVRREPAPALVPPQSAVAAPMAETGLQAATSPSGKAASGSAHRSKKKSTAKSAGTGKHAASPAG